MGHFLSLRRGSNMDWALCANIILLPATLCFPDSLADYTPPYGEKLLPKPFHYEYGANTQDSAFNKKETQDDNGNVFGEVVVSLPDGRIQTTNYNAHYYDGYVADVKYEGTPTYPPEQHKEYSQPKFIPVHLKARPGLPAPANFKFNHFPSRNQDIRAETIHPIIQTQGQSQRLSFESDIINNNNLPVEAKKISNKEESLAEMMARIREDLKTVKQKKQNTIDLPQNNVNQQFSNTVGQSQDSMAEIMKKVREDLKKLEKLKVAPVENQQASFKNIQSENNKKMKEMIKKMRENIAIQEKPPMLKIKSHIMPSNTKDRMAEIIKQMQENKKRTTDKPTMMSIKSHVVTPMSVMSHVISTPAPAESMAEIMKKIRQDLKKTNKIELPPPVMKIKSHTKKQNPEVPDNMKEIIKAIRNDLKTNEKLTLEGRNEEIKQFPTKKPLKDNVIDFMKKIELMKKKEKTPKIMSVKSRVIQQTNQDGDGNVSMKIVSHVIPENPKLY